MSIENVGQRANQATPAAPPTIPEMADSMRVRLVSIADDLRAVFDRIEGPAPSPLKPESGKTDSASAPSLDFALNRSQDAISEIEGRVRALRNRFG